MKLILIFSLLFLTFCMNITSGFSQELSPERKIYVLNNLQNDIHRLPYDTDYILNTLIPETQRKRFELAPHYPDLLTIERDKQIIDQAFVFWVTTYPQEYETYKVYLELFLRSHVSP